MRIQAQVELNALQVTVLKARGGVGWGWGVFYQPLFFFLYVTMDSITLMQFKLGTAQQNQWVFHLAEYYSVVSHITTLHLFPYETLVQPMKFAQI